MVAELVEGKSKLVCRLKDLTVDRNEGEHAAVQGLLLGASEDGSYVYFLANGVLSAASNPQGQQATPGDCTEGLENAPRQTCNLYVEHFDSQSGHQVRATTVHRGSLRRRCSRVARGHRH